MARVFQHPLDPGRVADIADLVAVAENSRGAVQQGGLRIGAGRHHAALDVDVGIDQPGGNDSVLRIKSRCLGEKATACRLDRGNAPLAQPELTVPEQFFGVHRKDLCAGDYQVRDVAP
jgi:hypothetical protein